MLRHIRISLLFAAILAVAACGGGSADTRTPGVDDIGNNPGLGVDPDPAPSDDQPAVENEPKLSGHMTLVANQMPYIDSDRDRFPREYNAVHLENFESTIGLYGVASGTSDGAPDSGFPATAPAPAAPVARFGFRVSKGLTSLPGGSSVNEETVIGRIAFRFSERADSPDMRPNQQELMSFVIDQVQITTKRNAQSGMVELESVRLLDDANMYLYGRNAAGTEVRQTIPVQANAIRLEPVSNIIDDYGDTDSIIVMADLEAAFAQGVEQLAALNNMAGHFSMDVTMSFTQLVRPSEPGDDGEMRQRRDLVGQSITVNEQPAVNGAGISGNIWIRAFPPQ